MALCIDQLCLPLRYLLQFTLDKDMAPSGKLGQKLSSLSTMSGMQEFLCFYQGSTLNNTQPFSLVDSETGEGKHEKKTSASLHLVHGPSIKGGGELAGVKLPVKQTLHVA